MGPLQLQALLAQRSLELVEELSPRMLVMTLLGLSSAVGQMEDPEGRQGPGGHGALAGDEIKIEEHQNVNDVNLVSAIVQLG